MKSFKELSALVKQWAADKDILRRDASPQQYLKILEETGETAAAILRNQPDKIKDGIGDMAVTMIIYAAQKGVAMEGRGKDSTDDSIHIDTHQAFQDFLEYIKKGVFLYAYDMLVILAAKHGLTLEECLEAAWDEIKNRKGKTVDNVFVKDEANSVWIKDENGFCVAIQDEAGEISASDQEAFLKAYPDNNHEGFPNKALKAFSEAYLFVEEMERKYQESIQFKSEPDPELAGKIITAEMFPTNDVEFQKAEALVVGKVYADIPFCNKNTVFLRFAKENDDTIYFEHIGGPNTNYRVLPNGLIDFYKEPYSFFYEVPDSIMEELGLKHDTVRQG